MAQIKLVDMWKVVNLDTQPFKPMTISRNENVGTTRACMAGTLVEYASSNESDRQTK